MCRYFETFNNKTFENFYGQERAITPPIFVPHFPSTCWSTCRATMGQFHAAIWYVATSISSMPELMCQPTLYHPLGIDVIHLPMTCQPFIGLMCAHGSDLSTCYLGIGWSGWIAWGQKSGWGFMSHGLWKFIMRGKGSKMRGTVL